MKTILPFLLIVLLCGCQSMETEETQKLKFSLSGDMLFEGANTLQAPAESDIKTLASKLQIDETSIKSIGVHKAVVKIEEKSEIVESLLLQIVSNSKDLTTVGTLSPLPSGPSYELSLAEEIDLKPYLADEGATWVLDLNLSEDHMENFQTQAEVSLSIKFESK